MADDRREILNLLAVGPLPPPLGGTTVLFERLVKQLLQTRIELPAALRVYSGQDLDQLATFDLLNEIAKRAPIRVEDLCVG